MKQTMSARYENGVFKPYTPPDLAEGENVTLMVLSTQAEVEKIIELGTSVYKGLSNEEIDAIEEVALDRSRFFGDRE